MGVIVTIYKGTGIGGALLYVLAAGKGQDGGLPKILDASYVEGGTVDELTQCFGIYRRIAGPGKDVWDVPFSYRREEAPDPLTRSAYAREWVQRMGLGDCPWVLVEHQDAEQNINDHLVLLAVDGTGERVHQAYDWIRSNRICGELDPKYGLRPENRKKRVEDPVLDPSAPGGKLGLAALQFESALDRTKAAGGSWRALANELKRGGYALVVTTHQKGKLAGQVRGIGVRDLVEDGDYFAGSELSRKWSYGKLQGREITGDILKELGHEFEHDTTEAGARGPGVGPETRDLIPRDRVHGQAPVPGGSVALAGGARGKPEGLGVAGAAAADPRQVRGHGRERPDAARNPGRKRPGGGLLPRDAAGLGRLAGGEGVPRLLAPSLRLPEPWAPAMDLPLPDPRGGGEAKAGHQARGRLATSGLPLVPGAGGLPGPAADDPTVGDALHHDSHMGGGPDLADASAGAIPVAPLPAGSDRPGRGGTPARTPSAAQAGLHDDGGGADQYRPDAPGGLKDMALAPSAPIAGGMDSDDLSEWGSLSPIHVQLPPMREIATENQEPQYPELPASAPKGKKKEFGI